METAEQYHKRVVIPAIEANDAAIKELLSALQKYIAETPLENYIPPNVLEVAEYLLRGGRAVHTIRHDSTGWEPLMTPARDAAKFEERAFQRMKLLLGEV